MGKSIKDGNPAHGSRQGKIIPCYEEYFIPSFAKNISFIVFI
jgi:hypothetical protein